jgi:hypothetical protein
MTVMAVVAVYCHTCKAERCVEAGPKASYGCCQSCKNLLSLPAPPASMSRRMFMKVGAGARWLRDNPDTALRVAGWARAASRAAYVKHTVITVQPIASTVRFCTAAVEVGTPNT